MNTAQVVETSATVYDNGPIQDYDHWNDSCSPGFKPFTGSNIVALRFGDHGTKEMLRAVCLKVQPVSNFAQQLPTSTQQHATWNWRNMHETSTSVCKGFQELYNWEFRRTPLETENLKIYVIK